MLTVKTKIPLPELGDLLEGAFRARSFVLIIGVCRVNYEGRASSTLEWGERVVIIKEDGSVLVHRPTGYEPVNWQPPRCSVNLSHVDTGTLALSAYRSSPRETVSIEFKDVSLAVVGRLKDDGDFTLHVTEAQMKQAILSAPDLVEEGLRPLEEEKYVDEAGFTDIYAEDKNGSLVVVEIKRNIASKDALLQLHGYLNKIRSRVNRPLRGIIVAPDLRRNVQPMLENLKIEFVKLAPEKCFKVLKTQKDMKLNQFMC